MKSGTKKRDRGGGIMKRGARGPPSGAGKSSQKLDDKDYWLALCPRLSITKQPARKSRMNPAGLIEADRVRQDLIEDGYSKISQGGAVVSQDTVAELAQGIKNLVRAGRFWFPSE